MKMDERTKLLTGLAYVFALDELSMLGHKLSEEEIMRLILENNITLDEMTMVDELVQDVLKEVKNIDR